MSRLPENYEAPQTASNYTKLKEGDNKVRILTAPVIGYEYFTVENKPKRSKTMFKETPDIKEDGKVKEFWAFGVWNYDLNTLQVMEITQAGIKTQLTELASDDDYGSPLLYDIKISKTGKGLDTRYQVKPLPPKDFDNAQAIKDAESLNLEALFDWADPFLPF